MGSTCERLVIYFSVNVDLLRPKRLLSVSPPPPPHHELKVVLHYDLKVVLHQELKVVLHHHLKVVLHHGVNAETMHVSSILVMELN